MGTTNDDVTAGSATILPVGTVVDDSATNWGISIEIPFRLIGDATSPNQVGPAILIPSYFLRDERRGL